MPPVSALPLHERFYQTLRHALVVGALHPGRDMSLRGLAENFGVGVMPVRDAVRRLAAEGALEITATRRIRVPVMDAPLFEDLMRARLLLEPECAARALPAITPALLRTIRGHDAALDRSFRDGDAQAYMTANHAFHFAIYRAAPSAVFTPMVESLWLRIGPFMRVVYGQAGTAALTDHHARAIDAIERHDAAALAAALEADISDGMRLLGRATFATPGTARLTKPPPLAEPSPAPIRGIARETQESGATMTCKKLWPLAILAIAAPLLAQPARAQKVLNVYNWSDYIGEHVIDNFQKRAGAKVNYDVFDANETLEAKLSAGSSGYDIAVPTLTPFLARGIKAGLYQKLDKSKLSNFKNLDPQLMGIMAKSDPGNEYAIPWVTAADALAYNVQKVKAIAPDAPTDSWAMLLDPAWAAKFKGCGIEMLDSPTDIFPTTMHYLGIDPNSTNPADLDRAMEALYKIRPFIRKFDSSGYINDLANGDACIAFGWSTDIALANRRAKEAGKNYQVALVLPKEGTLTYIDTMAVPAGAPHFDVAMQWLNFVMEPEQAADTTNTAGGRNGVPSSLKFIKPDIASDPGLFPPVPVQKTFFTLETSTPAFDRLRNRYWTRYKSGR